MRREEGKALKDCNRQKAHKLYSARGSKDSLDYTTKGCPTRQKVVNTAGASNWLLSAVLTVQSPNSGKAEYTVESSLGFSHVGNF